MLFTGPGGFTGSIVWATLAGSVSTGLMQILGPESTPMGVMTGVLSGVSVFLFSMFIRHGNKLAALEAYAKRNKDELDKHDAEIRTIDARDGASRHLVKNEVAPVMADMELRVDKRLEEGRLLLVSLEERMGLQVVELRERVARSEERMNRHLEERSSGP